MKRLLLSALLVLPALSLAACGTKPAIDAVTVDVTSAALPGNADEPTNTADTDLHDGESYLTLLWNGEAIAPCVRFLYSTDRVVNEDGSDSALSADGKAFFEGIRGAVGKMPTVGADFELIISEGCELTGLSLYDPETLEPLDYSSWPLEAKLELLHTACGKTVAEAKVTRTGRYIESAGKYESCTFGFAFITDGGPDPTERPETDALLPSAPPGAEATEAAPLPTAAPTAVPTAVPTSKPTAVPTAKPTAAPTAKPTAAPTAKPTAKPTAAPDPTDRPFVTNDPSFEGYLKVIGAHSGATEPFEHFESSQTYVEDAGGMLAGCGFSFYERLHYGNILPMIPNAGQGRGIRLVTGRDCRIVQISVYDAVSLDRLENSITKDALRRLLDTTEENLLIYVKVTKQGRYIEELDDYESVCYGWAFTVN
jgi:cell division septation protein DedD